jgi:hypothetical protein
MVRSLFGVLLFACGPEESGSNPDPNETDADTDSDTDSDTDTDTEPAITGCYDVPLTVTGGLNPANEAFTPAPPTGAIAQLVHGPQEGWHFDTSFRVEATHDVVTATPLVTLVSSGALISGRTDVDELGPRNDNVANVVLVLDGECSGTYTGARALVNDVDPDPDTSETLGEHICALDGAEVEITLEIVDLIDGRSGSATFRANLALDPMDVDGLEPPDCTTY